MSIRYFYDPESQQVKYLPFEEQVPFPKWKKLKWKAPPASPPAKAVLAQERHGGVMATTLYASKADAESDREIDFEFDFDAVEVLIKPHTTFLPPKEGEWYLNLFSAPNPPTLQDTVVTWEKVVLARSLGDLAAGLTVSTAHLDLEDLEVTFTTADGVVLHSQRLV